MGRTLDHGDFLNERTYLPTDLPFEKLVSILKRHWFADVSSTVRDQSFYIMKGVNSRGHGAIGTVWIYW